jgi:hypothetical protein
MTSRRFALTAGLIVSTALWLVAASSAAVRFPPKTPQWLVAATTRSATTLGDPNATVVRLTLGRFPIVVIHGDFTCTQCSRPYGASAAPTGHYASLRFDGITHQGLDFGLSPTRPGATGSLCGGSPCTSKTTLLDSAFRALASQSRAITEPFDHGLGSSHCKIRLPVPEMNWIWGTCRVSMTIRRTAVVTFDERWNGLDSRGRRNSPSAPHRHHTWRITETRAGFVKAISSSGDYPPQWRR